MLRSNQKDAGADLRTKKDQGNWDGTERLAMDFVTIER